MLIFGRLIGPVAAFGARLELVSLGGLALALGCLVCGAVMLRDDPTGSSLVFMIAIAAAACASSVAGFAFGAIAGGILFHLSQDTVRVVQIIMLCSVFNQATMAWALRHIIDWQGLANFVVTGAIGVGLGVWLLLHTDRSVYTTALGLFLLAYSIFMLVRRPLVLRGTYPRVDAAVGLLSGVVGGATGFPSAILVPWCAMKGWEKSRQRALFQPFILMMQIIALVAISVAHQGDGGGFNMGNILFLPASLLGTTIGMAFYRRLSDVQFARVVNVALMISGVSYVL